MKLNRTWILGALSLSLLAVACKKRGGRSAGDASSVSAAQGKAAPPAGGNLLKNATFEEGTSLPWTTSFTQPASGEAKITDGALCLRIDNPGGSAWDAQFRHREMVIQKGHTYTMSFRIWSDKPTMARPKLGMAGPPYAEYWVSTLRLTSEPQTVTQTFTMSQSDDPTAELAFHLGGNMARDAQVPFTVCIDDVYLSDPQFVPPPREAAQSRPKLRVNQVGYFPNARKLAVLVSDAASPLDFQLQEGGQSVYSGKTQPLGLDVDSGDRLHLIDFTKFKKAGSNFSLIVADDASVPFRIQDDLYSELKYDALNFFYQNRSGIEIKMPFSRQEKWARPPGHAGSDRNVPCAKDAGCSYQLDVSGGWYDAGDHGKYVVNGGISLWTLLNQFERMKTIGDISAMVDGKLKIPESGNGKPDLLDEARYEMEFLLKMQVPEGKEKAGMVHHKVHDENWTALGIAPHEAEAKMKRFLRPVSTAATLNLAATAAQAARLFKPFDPAFSAKCLAQAERAWVAAKQNPAILAPSSDANGGGPYDDKVVGDDFFWAAAELFVTTKDAKYKQELLASPFWSRMTDAVDGVPSAMNWASTDALGTISLAMVPGAVLAGEQAQQRKKVVDVADKFLAIMGAQGYRMPFNAGSSGKYPWGSNSFLLNNMVVLALAYDFTKQEKYLEGVIFGMDYLLGRNALAQSYVSGYGAIPLTNPHHRFWSRQYDARFPSAPPGLVSGGPNSGLQDPYVKAAGLPGCQPQKCFVDHIEAWSVNEITVNWNAPLAWVSAFLDENGRRAKAK